MNDKPTLKEINRQKKSITWGEIPPFFHMVSNTLADLEGINVHGFDNAFKRLIKRSNWNLKRIGGQEKLSGEIAVERLPEIVVHRRFVGRNYEVHCMPLVDDEPVVLFTKNDPRIDFTVWDPSTMQCLVKLTDFSEFIQYAFTRGDEADKALVRFAADSIDKILRDLATDIKIVGLKGYSIAHIIKRVEEEGIA